MKGNLIKSNKIDERFTFIKNGERLEHEEILFWQRRTFRKNSNYETGNHHHIKSLKRGIGIHYEALTRSFRHLVETLFRAKHIKVVITTSTLAMGVNMPARSVIFAGDHSDLNPLGYRQMMGRAGRRGYDNVGYVIFLGIRPKKISYLMTSQLTCLIGHYPITPTMCLKLMHQYEEFKEKKDCINVMKNFVIPHFSPEITDYVNLTRQLCRNMRFMIEVMYHFGLTDSQARCRGLSGIASSLMQYEPGNLIFVRLIEAGVFHNITKNFEYKNKNKSREITTNILLVLCHIFDITPIIPEKKRSNKITPAILPPLSKEIQGILNQFDQETISLFEHFTRSFSIKKDSFYHKTLPISLRNFNKLKPLNIKSKSLVAKLLKLTVKPDCISLFTILIDPKDRFLSIEHLKETIRDDFNLHPCLIPYSSDYDFRGRQLSKNSFAYNFYQSRGNYELVINSNFLRDGFAWGKLKRIQLLLIKIHNALRFVCGFKIKLQKKYGVLKEKRITSNYNIQNGKKDFSGNVKIIENDMFDNMVQSFSFLEEDFRDKFKNIKHIEEKYNKFNTIDIIPDKNNVNFTKFGKHKFNPIKNIF